MGKPVQEDINNFWMGHAPETMSETYSRLDLQLDIGLVEAQSMGRRFQCSARSNCSKSLHDFARI